MSYLTFEEYQALGGKCTESAFPNLQFEVESKLDYITSNNLSACLKEVETIPEAVKRLEVKLINILQNANNERDTSLSSYSNGIETFGYVSTSNENNVDLEGQILSRFKEIAMQYLSAYPQLFYRGRYIDYARNNNPFK